MMPRPLDHLRALVAAVMALVALTLQPAAAQERYLDIRPGGEFRPVTIAVTGFAGGEDGARITGIISNDFKRSVFLSPTDPSSFPEQNVNPEAPQMAAWQHSGAQFVVTGRTQRQGDGRIKTEFRLWDASNGQQVAGQQYVTDASNNRRVAHIVADAVFSRITGEKGCFDSRVVFVEESGPANNRRKRLAIMDQDGANVKYLTRGNEMALTPNFSPNSQQVTFMAFPPDTDPKVFLLDIESGQRQVVGSFTGMTFAPRFSPDGQKVVMSLNDGANSNLYSMDLRSHSTTRLTNTAAIDTSPSYSPDGSQIVFESDRGGNQQLYIMSASGGSAKRISFGEGRYSTPAWSPKGDYIAFTRQKGGSFGIGVMKPDGSGERILTEGFHNEGPTWAPNGLYLMFFRDPGGNSGPKIFMTDVFGRAEFPVPTAAYASDPSWGPLLK